MTSTETPSAYGLHIGAFLFSVSPLPDTRTRMAVNILEDTACSDSAYLICKIFSRPLSKPA